MEMDSVLNPFDQSTFYGGNEKGYTSLLNKLRETLLLPFPQHMQQKDIQKRSPQVLTSWHRVGGNPTIALKGGNL